MTKLIEHLESLPLLWLYEPKFLNPVHRVDDQNPRKANVQEWLCESAAMCHVDIGGQGPTKLKDLFIFTVSKAVAPVEE